MKYFFKMQKFKNFFNKRKQFKKYSGKTRKILGSAVLAGTLLFRTLKSDSDKTQNDSTARAHERVIANQEFNSLQDSHNSGRTVQIQTGNGRIFAVASKEKADDSSFNEEFSFLDQDNQQVTLVVIGDKADKYFFQGPSNLPVSQHGQPFLSNSKSATINDSLNSYSHDEYTII